MSASPPAKLVPSPHLAEVVLLMVAVALCVAWACAISFVVDDTYVSFRYAYHLVHDGELTFNLGERVEGYTNPLYTLFLAACYAAHVSLPLAARAISGASALGSLCVVWCWARELDRRWAAVAVVLLAAEPCHALWSQLGLEVTLLGFLLVLAFWAVSSSQLRRAELWVGVCVSLAYFTRPEAALALPILCGVRLLQDRALGRATSWAAILVLPCLAIAGHLIFREAYYGALLPNTFYVKATVSSVTFRYGVPYVAVYLASSALVLVPLLLAISRPWRALPPAIAGALIFAGVLSAYVAAVGGDYMGASRFLAPLSPLLVISLVWLARELCERGRVSLPFIALVIAACTIGLGARRVASELSTDGDAFISRVSAMEAYVHDWEIVGAWLRPRVNAQDTVTSSAVGIAAWALLPARVIDARGLTDAWVARHGLRGPFRPGHTVFAPEDYLLSKKPQLLFHRYGFLRARELATATDNARILNYHAVCVHFVGLWTGDFFCFAKRNDVAITGVGLPPTRAGGPLVALHDAPSGQTKWVQLSAASSVMQ